MGTTPQKLTLTRNYTPVAPGTIAHNNTFKYAGYYSPFGLRFGGNVGGFIEVGIGYKGVFNGGVSYVFKSHITSKVKTTNAEEPETIEVKKPKVKKPHRLIEYDN